MGLRRTRRRRPAEPGSRPRAIGGLGTPTPADDPAELVIRTTPDGRYTYVSPAVRSILGYEPDELLAQAPFETVHPDDLTLVGSAGDRLAAGSDQESVLLRKRHADGHDVWLDARIATGRDPATGQVVEIRATARDVTAQVVTERALRQRVGAESLIGDVSRRLLTATAEEIDQVVVGSLERAARFVGAERATLALLSDDGEAAIRTHEWVADPDFEIVESRVPVATMPWLIEQCRRGELVFARSLDDFPEAACVERDLFERNGVRSLACAPITFGDHLTGGLAFSWRTRVADDCSAALSTLGVLADVLVVALDRRDAERAVASSEARFRSLVQGTSDLILVTDREGVVRFASPSSRQFGYSERAVVGRSVFSFLHPDDVDRVTERFLRTLACDARHEPVECRLRDGTGAWRFVEALGTDHSDNPAVQGVVINVRDISERKAAEAALRESEERFRALVQHGTDMITVLDADGLIIYTSPSATSILGWRDGEYVGRSVFALLHPDDRERVRKVFAEAVTRPGSTEPIHSRMRHTNGEYRLLESIATNLLDDPAVHGLVINGRDITERQQLESELLQSQKMEAVGRLAGGIAHDFNNLLTAIAGYTALLLDEHPDDQSLRADLGEIEQAATRGAALVDQLLSFSRRKMLMPTVLDLNEVVESTRGLLSRVIGADVELVTRLARKLDGVRADRTQIEQVLLNLAVNARDAMPDGGRLDIETANVTLRPRDSSGHVDAKPGPHVLLSVRDTGTGMDRATQAQVFEPFFTTKEVGAGSGLGLSTAYGIVTQAGGHISVDSRLGAGTTFRVYLPTEARDPGTDAPPGDDTTPRGGRETILLVEDESAVRSLARDVLTRLGYDVLVAADGREAVKVADRCRRRINLLVSDVVLPYLRGVEVADRLRARRPELRVLYISGYTETAIVHDGQLEPGVDFLAKPFRPADLAHRVREVLDA